MPSQVNITLSITRGFAWQIANSDQNANWRAIILSRFWARVNRTHAKDCWPFLGPIEQHGYGTFTYSGVRIRAHRLAWLLSRGPIPDDLCVCHSCDNKRCVNPSHLFLGTQKENMYDAVRKGRKRAWGLQKLNAEQVLEIRSRAEAGEFQKDIAAAFGISRNHVSSIVNRTSWAHLSHAPTLRAVAREAEA